MFRRSNRPVTLTPLSPEELRQDAREVAMARLEKREHSRRELEIELEEREFPTEIVTETLDQLIEEKLLDDRRYSEAVIHGQAARGKGPGVIHQKLLQKGVRIELDEVRAILGESSGRDELEQARRLVQRRYPRALENERELGRAYAALLRGGFSAEVARQALSGRIPREAEGAESL